MQIPAMPAGVLDALCKSWAKWQTAGGGQERSLTATPALLAWSTQNTSSRWTKHIDLMFMLFFVFVFFKKFVTNQAKHL